MKTKFYYCPKCGNVIIKTVDSGVTPSCCGEKMTELTPNSIDAKTEYHVPVAQLLTPCSLKVCIGKEPHPMTQEHSIRFVYVETEHTGHIVHFCPDHPAEAIVSLSECPKIIYAYCNLHGLWMSEPFCKPEKDNCGKKECKK